MRVADIMTSRVVTCLSSDSLLVAAQIMWDHDCGAVPVVDGRGDVVAMITDRDICMAAYTQGKPIAETSVMTAASHQVHSVRPGDSVESAQVLMRRYRIRRLPVIDMGRNLVGIVALADLVHNQGRDDALAPEILTSTIAAVSRPHADVRPSTSAPSSPSYGGPRPSSAPAECATR